MSSDSGARKRNVQNKKKKGSTGNISSGGITIREIPVTKSSAEELIHVQKDVQFADNWCKVVVFVAISSALLAVGCYILAENNSGLDKPKEPPKFDWISALRHVSNFFYRELEEEAIDEEPSVDTQIESSYLDLLWAYYPFGQKDEQVSEEPSETTEQDDDVSKEAENEKYSHEDDSKESADDENDQDDHESEENLDDEKNTDEDDDEKDNDGDDDDEDTDDESNSADDSENLYQPYESYNYHSYRKHDTDDEPQNDNKDDEESSESEEQVDRRDQRFNYYHKRDSEEVKYDHIIKEDEPNDSSEHEGSEKFDSVEKTKFENDEDTNILEDESHSSEEVQQHESVDFPELQPPVEPDFPPKKDEPESGNLITKLSVGIALIFVAYSVIIRKWNNYVNRVPNDAEIIFGVASENDEDLADIAQTIAENLLDSMNDSNSFNETSEAENKTLQDYLETPSNSANEQSEDDSVNEKDNEDNLPVDSENSQTASETEGETDEDSEYEKSDYERMNITNRDDWPYRHQLDEADEDWDNQNPMNATLKYTAILDREPRSIRAQYGLVRFYDSKADTIKSNEYLLKVIRLYKKLLNKPNIPEALEKVIAERTVDRMKFIGSYDEAIRLLKVLVKKYPQQIAYQIDLAITYLIVDKLLHAEILLGKVIQKEPNNGVALVNYGFIMKQKGELEKAVKVLRKGISSGEKGTQDSKFYYHLGEALQRLGRHDEALKFYQKAAEKGIFLSKYQRSLYNVYGLLGKPWWNPADTEYNDFFVSLESNWKTIRDEVKPLLENEQQSSFQDEAEQLREKGEWKQLELFSRGVEQPACKDFPFTCGLIKSFAPAAECRRGQVKFSIMKPGTHVWPHCGPTNCRLRAHLGLIVPKNVSIRVADETRSWHEGKVLLFDDSFEHEVWHNGTSSRLILIVDVWHPNLSDFKRKILPAI